MDEDSVHRLEQLLSGGYVLVPEKQIAKSRRANYWNLIAVMAIAIFVVCGSFLAVDRITSGYKESLKRSQAIQDETLKSLSDTQTALLKFQTDTQCRSVANLASSAALDHLVVVGLTMPVDPLAVEAARLALVTADKEAAAVAANGCN
jgi:hypothetical protein